MAWGQKKQEAREPVETTQRFLRRYESMLKKEHDGTEPVTGLKKKGRLERKEICEDAKLLSKEKGLFVLADGVSVAPGKTHRGNGWYASREVVMTMNERLGEELDREIENNVRGGRDRAENILHTMTDYIKKQMNAALAEAHQRIEQRSVQPEFAGAATTASVGKLVELPDGKGELVQRFFFANIGDSRIYVKRSDGKLERLTQDDSWVHQKFVKEKGDYTQEEYDLMDQNSDPRKLPPHLMALKSHIYSSRTMNSVGSAFPSQIEVMYIDLDQGDTIMMASDGVSDQLREKEMEAMLTGQDKHDEQVIQQAALDMSMDGTRFRSKADDISLNVFTAEQRGPSREYLDPDVQSERALEEDKARVQDYGRQILEVRARRSQAKRELTQYEQATRMEQLPHLIEIKGLEAKESFLEAHMEQAELDVFAHRMPPRFSEGNYCDMYREDLDPPRVDERSWRVLAYDSSMRQYTIESPGRTQQKISRYELERHQPVVVRVGDVVSLEQKKGFHPDWHVISVGKEEKVIYAQEVSGGLYAYEHLPIAQANKAVVDELYFAERRRHRMEAAVKVYKRSMDEVKTLTKELELHKTLESKQKAEELAK